MRVSLLHPLLLLFSMSVATVLSKSPPGVKCAENEYYNTQKASCQLCDIACNGCRGPTQAGCIQCAAGYANQSNSCDLVCDLLRYYVDLNTFQCKKCDASCTNDFIESATNCNSCGQNLYRPDTDSCALDCPQAAGYYSNSFENRCVPCRDSACLSCEKDGECSKCAAWWQFDYSGRCVYRCPTGCASCASSDVDGKIFCRKCFIGWTMEHNGTCSCRYKNCLHCGENGCLSCPEGFLLDPLTQSCEECVKDCRVCQDRTTCSVCSPGYRLSQDASSCARCPNGCKYCTASRCTACEDGYHLDDSGKCAKVSYNYAPVKVSIEIANVSETGGTGNNTSKSTKTQKAAKPSNAKFGRRYKFWLITIAIAIFVHL